MDNLDNIRQFVLIKFIQKNSILSESNLWKAQWVISASQQIVAMHLIGGCSLII